MTVFNLSDTDLQRVCRDIAWSELSTMPHVRSLIDSRLGSQLENLAYHATLTDSHSLVHSHSWAVEDLEVDSLARMQLATAAATWCNAYDAGFEDLFLAKRSSAEWAQVMQRARAAGAENFTFSSSGSTGARKHIRHHEDVLASEATVWAQIVNNYMAHGVTDQHVERVVLLVPTNHIYGFIWGVLLPHALGKPVVEAELSALPDLQTGDLIVAVPDQWAWLAQASDSAKPWPLGVQGISSTAPLSRAVHSKLIANYQIDTSATSEFLNQSSNHCLSRLLQIYGSSETAGLAYRADPAATYTLAPSRSRFVDTTGESHIQLQLPNGTLATMDVQDELQWVNDTDFELLRRSDHSVQVGGHNLSPDWVVLQLLKNPHVKEASVRLSTQQQPPKLKAFVVLNQVHSQGDVAAQQSELERWIANTLPHYATFNTIVYGKELPKSATGKLCDWED